MHPTRTTGRPTPLASLAALAPLTLALLGPTAYAQLAGTAHPETLADTVTTTTVAPLSAKPSAGIPAAVTTTTTTELEGSGAHYVPRANRAGALPAQSVTSTTTTETGLEPILHTRSGPPPSTTAQPWHDTTPLPRRQNEVDPALRVTEDVNSGVVTEVPSHPGELGTGQLLHARLETSLSTSSAVIGTPFSARLEQPVERAGVVLLPAGTVLHGRVADVHGGSRLRGGALLRLQPDSVTLPDGSTRSLSADLVDLDGSPDTRVNREGEIHERSHAARDLSAAGLATGGGAVVGALVGGGLGAVVGAGIGAGVSTVVWLRQDKQEALPQGTLLIFALNEPLTVRASAW